MKIHIIIGSTRPGRVGPQIAKWMVGNLPKNSDIEYEIVDIAEYGLPLFDEPMLPSMNQYKYNHTKIWSKKIKEADAFIFLTPEYNAGYPAPLKNAIDYLHDEWVNKAVMIASYGVRGGTTASAQLHQVAERLKMRPTKTSPAFAIGRDKTANGQIKDITESFNTYTPTLMAAGEELLDSIKTPVVSGT